MFCFKFMTNVTEFYDKIQLEAYGLTGFSLNEAAPKLQLLGQQPKIPP